MSWSGDVLETIYETPLNTYHNTLALAVAAANGTTYIARTLANVTTLFLVQSGVARERYSTMGPIWILDHDEEAITFAQGNTAGVHQVVKLCAAARRMRAVR